MTMVGPPNLGTSAGGWEVWRHLRTVASARGTFRFKLRGGSGRCLVSLADCTLLTAAQVEEAVESFNGSPERFWGGFNPRGERWRVICHDHGRRWLGMEVVDDEPAKQARPWDAEEFLRMAVGLH